MCIPYLNTPNSSSSTFFFFFFFLRDGSHKSYRPFTTLTFRAQYILSGENPAPFVVVNLLLHALCSCLVFSLARKVLKETLLPALVAAVWFAVHPVHVEAVANVSGRAELLALCLGLAGCEIMDASLRLMDEGRLEGHGAKQGSDQVGQDANDNHSTTDAAAATGSTPWRRALAALLWILGLAVAGSSALCKESGMLIPAAWVAIDLARSGSLVPRPWRLSWWWAPLRAAAALGMFAAYIRLRMTIMDGKMTPQGLLMPDNPVAFVAGIDKLRTALATHGEYLRLLTFPTQFSSDYGFACVTVQKAWGDARVHAGIVLHALVLLALILAVAARSMPLYAGAIWLAVPFVPASHALRIGTTVAERLMYTPSVGPCLLMGALFLWLGAGRTRIPAPFLAALALVPISHSAAQTWRRTAVLCDYEAMVREDLQLCPNSLRLLGSLGMIEHSQGRHREAVSLFEKSVKLGESAGQPKGAFFGDWNTQFVFGLSLLRAGRPKDAVLRLRPMIDDRSGSNQGIMRTKYRMNVLALLAEAYEAMGDKEEAAKRYSNKKTKKVGTAEKERIG